MSNQRQNKMKHLFAWFAIELAGNVSVAFALGCFTSILMSKSRFLKVQGLFMGFGAGLAIQNA